MSAARRASCESSIVQHPREPVRRVPGLADRARCTPTTSCPASTARAAATAESTPPLIAAKTRISLHLLLLGLLAHSGEAGLPGAHDDATDLRSHGLDVCGGGCVAERETEGTTGRRRVGSHGEQHVARLGDACCTCRSR